LIGGMSERPWYFAITASAGVHLVLILGAAWIFVDTRASGPPADIEARWDENVPIETLVQASSVLELGAGPSASGKKSGDEGQSGLGSIAAMDQAAQQPSRRTVELAQTSSSLTTRWLTDSRSAQGLTDLVGPIVYGADGRLEGGSGSGKSGNGNGGGGGGLKATFFGVASDARRIVYVVDASSSMNRPYDGEAKTRFGQMKLELAKSVLSLKPEQQFFIVFFNEHANPMPADGMANATPENQQSSLAWVAGVHAVGLTDPRPSLELALGLNPDVVYLLTDGAFPRDVQSDLSHLRQHSIQINTIAFGDPKAEKSLKPLALKNRCRFAFVP
jgi:hypothetical protein